MILVCEPVVSKAVKCLPWCESTTWSLRLLGNKEGGNNKSKRQNSEPRQENKMREPNDATLRSLPKLYFLSLVIDLIDKG